MEKINFGVFVQALISVQTILIILSKSNRNQPQSKIFHLVNIESVHF